MDGKTFAAIIERELLDKGISKGTFYDAVGITAAAMWGWKNGSTPKDSTVVAIEKYLNISFADYEKSEQLEELRDDLRILLRSAKDLPPSSVYSLIAQIEKEKEKSVLPD